MWKISDSECILIIYMLSSTANSIFKTDTNLKNIMANYHLHSMSIILHYQIRFSCAHARVLAFKYKSAFSVLHVHMLIFFFKNLYTIKLLEDRPVSLCKVKCLNLQRNARNSDRLSVLVHRTFLRDRHYCTKRSTPMQLCWTLIFTLSRIFHMLWIIRTNTSHFGMCEIYVRPISVEIVIGTSFSQMSNFRRVKNVHVFVTHVKNSFLYFT